MTKLCYYLWLFAINCVCACERMAKQVFYSETCRHTHMYINTNK